MSVSARHGNGFVARKLLDLPQGYTEHGQTGNERVPETVPSEIQDTGLATGSAKPFPWRLERMTGQIAVAGPRRNHDRPRSVAPCAKGEQGIHGGVVQRNIPYAAVFASCDGDLTALKIHTVPRQPVLLAPAHPGMKRQIKRGQFAGIVSLNNCTELRLFIGRKPPDATAILTAAVNDTNRVRFNLSAFDSEPVGKG